ncbi:MAG TPA: cupin, partial [Arthrobacter sp.]|nr:cupin [Arthrobacter sp.]
MKIMDSVEHENFGKPSETRTFPHGKAEILNMGNGTIGRLTLEPGWRWSNDVKPIAGTESCEAPHFQYHVS